MVEVIQFEMKSCELELFGIFQHHLLALIDFFFVCVYSNKFQRWKSGRIQWISFDYMALIVWILMNLLVFWWFFFLGFSYAKQIRPFIFFLSSSIDIIVVVAVATAAVVVVITNTYVRLSYFFLLFVYVATMCIIGPQLYYCIACIHTNHSYANTYTNALRSYILNPYTSVRIPIQTWPCAI